VGVHNHRAWENLAPKLALIKCKASPEHMILNKCVIFLGLAHNITVGYTDGLCLYIAIQCGTFICTLELSDYFIHALWYLHVILR